MWAVGKLLSNAKALYKEINSATLTGAIDVVAVEQEDGSYIATPFHVRFGKLGVIRSKEKVVYIEINGDQCELCMKLGDDGEAFFVENTAEQLPPHLVTSPIPTDTECEAARPSSDGGAKRTGPELSRVLSDSALFVPGAVREYRERHESEGKSAHRGGDPNRGGLLVPTVGASGAYFEPIGLATHRDTVKNGDLAASRQQQAELSTAIAVDVTQQYPLSDTDATPGVSPHSSRPASPKSDTELDVGRVATTKTTAAFSDSGIQQWHWGELPSRNLPPSPMVTQASQLSSVVEQPSCVKDGSKQLKAAEDSGLSSSVGSSGGLLSFMRKSKPPTKPAEDQGIYLDDLKLDEMDPEVAALYFPKREVQDAQKEPYSVSLPTCKYDDDTESGQGASLPHSPSTVIEIPPVTTTASASTAASETDVAAVEHVRPPFAMFGDVAMSLCGGLKDPESSITMDKFMHHLVTFEDFCKDPNVFSNPNLVFRMHGKFFNWKVAAPMMMSFVAFNLPLPDDTIGALVKQHMPKEERRRGMFSWWGSKTKADTAKEVESSTKVDPKASMKAEVTVAAPDSKEVQGGSAAAIAAPVEVIFGRDTTKAGLPAVIAGPMAIDSGDEADDETTTADVCHKSSADAAAKAAAAVADNGRKSEEQPQPLQDQCFKKTLRLSSCQLKRLKLREGCNDIEYSVTTALQGTTRCVSHVYLWKWTDKVVISDIDGTITRSDVLGQLLPMVGKDWSQGGVVQLYNRIAANGYKFVYLSARAIGQAQITRDYLRSVRQEQASLPPGPMLLSPTSLINAFHKEVIERKPEEFKISCLRDVKSLFPSCLSSPLYAGFGNKINDVWAYRAVDIPISRIFTINPKGELRHELSQTFLSSYTQLSDVADHFFPPVHALGSNVKHMESSDYSSFAYWRSPLPDIALDPVC